MMATPNKYDSGDSLQWSLAADDVSISQHARHRYRERTPQHAEQAVGAAEAFRRGEYIEHPEICGKLHSSTDHGLERVRLYLHPCDSDGGYQWGVVFLIQQNRYYRDNPGQNRASTPLVVATTVALRQIDHGPTKAYLSGRGAHRVDGGCS
jgi:hypothetical protein